MRWNMRKTYLRDLENAGVTILPTRWLSGPSQDELRAALDAFGTDEIVVKPVVGANAQDVLRLRADAPVAAADTVVTTFRGRDCIAQPFIHEIVTEGEYSLIYFHGEYSHAILKSPKRGDFRVQEEHGGHITAAVATPGMRACGAAALAALDTTPLYARVDFVRVAGDHFAVMELELIEPALYLRMDADAPGRFAAAVDAVLAPVTA
jgi:glutathione synthase/RimK-type ligase-like ATP-grasp enzyme